MEKKLIKIPLLAEASDKIFLRIDGKTLNDAGFKPGEMMDIKIDNGRIQIERSQEIVDIEEIANSLIRQKSYYDCGYNGYKVSLRLERQNDYEPRYLSNSKDVYDFLKPLQYESRENVLSVMLDTKNKVVGVYESAKGGIDSAMLTPYEVLQPACLANSKRIILAHNHPSGDSTPSIQDRDITSKIKQASDLMSMQLLDHIVIGDENYTSFKANGYL